jgi:hypothetical protein
MENKEIRKQKLLIDETKLSNDYDRLFNLIKEDQYEVICFIKYSENMVRKDICLARYLSAEENCDHERATIGARGIAYIDAFPFNKMSTEEDFKQQCVASDVWFLDM